MNLDELARDAAEALRRSVERAVPDEPRRAGARRRRPAAAVAVALLVTVALASASLWVRANAPEQPGQVVAPVRPSTAAATGQQSGDWRRLNSGPRGLLVDQMVWTGTRALVFAGATTDQSKVDGALYDPRGDRWQAIERGPLDWRAGAAVAWTGQRLVVWGGAREVPLELAGGAYDPGTDSWAPIAAGPLRPGTVMAAAWTGTELLVWLDAEHGAAYDPKRDTWRRLSAAFPLPQADRNQPAVVWTGREVIIWGGCDNQTPQCEDSKGDELRDGAAYDPARDRWRPIAASPLAARDRPQGVWTGRELVVWGGIPRSGAGGAYAAAYDPAGDTWRTIPDGPLAPRSNHTMVWTGRELVVWGGVANGTGDHFLADGAAFDPATGAWAPLPRAPIRGRDRHVAVWTGQELLVWGGCCAGTQLLADGAALRPT